MSGLVRKLTSRKFWLAVSAAAAMVAAKRYGEALAVVLAYLGVETTLDLKAAPRA